MNMYTLYSNFHWDKNREKTHKIRGEKLHRKKTCAQKYHRIEVFIKKNILYYKKKVIKVFKVLMKWTCTESFNKIKKVKST